MGGDISVDGEVLACLNLDLEPQPPYWWNLGLEPVHECDVRFTLVPPGLPEPRESSSDAVEKAANGTGANLYEVNVLRVTGRRRKHEFVKRCPTSKGERLCQMRVREDFDQGAGEHQILLNHPIIRPWRNLPPCHNVGLRNHKMLLS